MISIMFNYPYNFTMKKVKEIKIDFFKFNFLNTDSSITILSCHLKLYEYHYNVPPERSMSQIFNIGLSFIF